MNNVGASRKYDGCHVLMTTGWLITSCYVILKLLNELRKVYCCFGLFRSPLYNTMKGRVQCVPIFKQNYKIPPYYLYLEYFENVIC